MKTFVFASVRSAGLYAFLKSDHAEWCRETFGALEGVQRDVEGFETLLGDEQIAGLVAKVAEKIEELHAEIINDGKAGGFVLRLIEDGLQDVDLESVVGAFLLGVEVDREIYPHAGMNFRARK